MFYKRRIVENCNFICDFQETFGLNDESDLLKFPKRIKYSGLSRAKVWFQVDLLNYSVK